MKILLTSNFCNCGGDSVFVKYLQELLIAKGFKADLFLSGTKLMHPYNFFFGTNPMLLAKFRKTAKRYDVVHHHNISLIGYNVLQKCSTYKNIYTCHDFWLACPCSDKLCKAKSCAFCSLARLRFQLWRYSWRFKKAVNSIDVITAPSVYMKKQIEELLSRQVQYLPNFADNSFNEKSITDTDYFLYVGEVSRNKGALGLISLFEKIGKNLVVIGPPKAKITAKNIKCLGWQNKDTIFSYMQNATALIVPSYYNENSPMVIHEANALGTRVIARNTGGIPEIVNKKNLFSTEEELIEKIESHYILSTENPVTKKDFLKWYLRLIK